MLDTVVGTWTGVAGRRLESERLPPDDHRPWPVPDRPWVMTQSWEDLLFLHWPIRASMLRTRIPSLLRLDTFGGNAWVGITPFRVTGVRLRGLPALPGLSSFTEINVRTYVRANGIPGIFFFSLDADSALAVAVGRLWYRLPYFFAFASAGERRGAIHFTSRRDHEGAAAAEFAATYRATGSAVRPSPQTLEWWLTERYCLFALDEQGRLHRAEIHHPPWTLRPAEVMIPRNSLGEAAGLELDAIPPLAHLAEPIDVSIWSPEPAERGARVRTRSAPRRKA
jgi:uncharacterized protein YqjF (DUF2071 family)